MNGVHIRKRKGRFDTHTQGDMKNGGRDWSDAFIRQGMPRVAGDHQKVEESHEMELSFKVSR